MTAGTACLSKGTRRIPENEMEMAADLYVALQRFFKLHPHMRRRPLIISGESYAGDPALLLAYLK
jgi:vitellogenic carboxypeptidase-like protein